jgi:methionyl-tRNA formyltransferase
MMSVPRLPSVPSLPRPAARLVFCGTPQFAVPTLEALLKAGHEIALAVTQPDRPAGRGRQLTAPPVKQAALAAGLHVTQPEKIRGNPEFRAQLESIAPHAIVVVAYGRILPPWMLALPQLGCINLHASLLPKYRGAAPIQWAVAMGDAYTGNTTMLLEEGLDTGPMLLQQEVEIGPDQTAVELSDLLARCGAPLVVETLAGLADGTIHPQPQNHSGATYAPRLDREDGRMDFAARTAMELKNRWRGFQPWPGAFTVLDGRKLIVHRMEAAPPGSADSSFAPGTPAQPGQVRMEGHRLLVRCAGDTWIELLEVQFEGKKRLPAAEFLRGAGLAANARLG